MESGCIKFSSLFRERLRLALPYGFRGVVAPRDSFSEENSPDTSTVHKTCCGCMYSQSWNYWFSWLFLQLLQLILWYSDQSTEPVHEHPPSLIIDRLILNGGYGATLGVSADHPPHRFTLVKASYRGGRWRFARDHFFLRPHPVHQSPPSLSFGFFFQNNLP